MRRVVSLMMLTAALSLSGCQSHEAKVADLQKEYDRLAAQRQKDCASEIVARSMNPLSHPNLSPKCTDEDNQTAAAFKRLQGAQAQN